LSAFSCRWTHVACLSQELGQADDVIGRHGEDEDGANLVEPAYPHLRQAADSLRPAEAFLDALAQPLTDRITEARGDLRRNGGLARLAGLAHRPVDRDVRRDPTRLQALDEGLGVVALVGAEGRPLGQALADESRRRLARSAVPVANVASAAATSPLRFSIKAWPR
jgi:hypothetical protein